MTSTGKVVDHESIVLLVLLVLLSYITCVTLLFHMDLGSSENDQHADVLICDLR